MATTPNDLLLASGKIHQADVLEAEIDQKLEAQSRHFNGRFIYVELSHYPGEEVLAELKKRYTGPNKWKDFEFLSTYQGYLIKFTA